MHVQNWKNQSLAPLTIAHQLVASCCTTNSWLSRLAGSINSRWLSPHRLQPAQAIHWAGPLGIFCVGKHTLLVLVVLSPPSCFLFADSLLFCRYKWLSEEAGRRFGLIYALQQQGTAFETPEEWLQQLDLYNMTQQSAADYMKVRE